MVLISEGLPLADDPIRGDRRPFLVELEQLAVEARTIIYALKLDPRTTDIRRSAQNTNLGPELTGPATAAGRGAARSQGGPGLGGPETMPGPANAPAPDRVEAGSGLYSVAAVTGGSMFSVVMTADSAFARIISELSGYYLIGVESDPVQRDGKAHPIEVTVARPGATVRSRRQLIVSPRASAPRNTQQMLARALSSPQPSAALPLRIATVARRSDSATNLQIVIYGEIGAGYSSASDILLGYAITDGKGRVIRQVAGKSMLRPVLADRPSPLQLTIPVSIAPGDYTLRLAVVADDRVGSLEHSIHAGVTTSGPLAFSDLVVGGSAVEKPPQTPANATVRQQYLHAFVEAYGPGASGVSVRFDIAAGLQGPAIASVSGAAVATGRDRAVLSNVIPVAALASGRYVLRATMSVPGRSATTLVRGFEIDR